MKLDKTQILANILLHFDEMGDLQYDGEPVTQLEHAWQCYQLAKYEVRRESLQCAAFLHDYGHLLSKRKDTPTLEGHDDRHEITGANYLQQVFPLAVTEPIRLHVPAKRYLVTVDALYYDCLSEDSKRSLVLQGGKMKSEEITEFLNNPFALDAVDLRCYDDLAKAKKDIGDRQMILDTLRELCERCTNV